MIADFAHRSVPLFRNYRLHSDRLAAEEIGPAEDGDPALQRLRHHRGLAPVLPELLGTQTAQEGLHQNSRERSQGMSGSEMAKGKIHGISGLRD